MRKTKRKKRKRERKKKSLDAVEKILSGIIGPVKHTKYVA